MNERNPLDPNSTNESSLPDDRQAIPMGQQSISATTSHQAPSGSGEMPPSRPSDSSSEHAKGVIPKAAEAAEQAAEKGLEKTSSVVGSAIDKVADAAISVLQGSPKSDRQN